MIKRENLNATLFLKIALFIVLFLGLLHPPEVTVYDNHDVESVAAGEYWTMHKLSYGIDVIQNIGPLGFVSYPSIYTGLLDHQKFALILLLAFAYAALSIRTAWRLEGDKAKIFFLLLVWIFSENHIQHYMLSLLMGYTLYFSISLGLGLVLIPLLVVLSLAKSTLLFIAPLMVFLAALHHALARRWLLASLLAGSYITVFVAVWWLIGQPAANILSFIEGALHFSQGYNETLAYFESRSVSILGFLSIGLAGITILWKRIGSARHGPFMAACDQLLLALIEGTVLFVVWKHGFTRADGHVAIFFGFLAVAMPLYVWLPGPEAPHLPLNTTSPRWPLLTARWLAMTVVVILCIAGYERTFRFHGPGEILLFGTEWNRMKDNAAFLSDVPGHFQDLDSRLKETVKPLAMPKVNAIAGTQGVGYFGSLPGIMVYNRFAYRPMPATISFAASNPWVMERDAAFFREDTAPHYVLYYLDVGDNRLSAQYDATAQIELLQHYNFVLEEKGTLLLERRRNAASLSFQPQAPERTYSLKEWVELPPAKGPTWIRIDVPETIIGKALSIPYKPPQYDIEYTLASGETVTRKLIAGMARVGFMIAPLINTNREFLSANQAGEYARFISGKKGHLDRIVQFRIHCAHERISCAKTFAVSLYSIHGLELGRLPQGK